MRGSAISGMCWLHVSPRPRFAEGMTGNAIQAVVRPLERLAVSGSYAIGVYLALDEQ